MIRGAMASLATLGVLLGALSVATAAALPTKLGQCSDTRVKAIESRLVGAPDSGSAVSYANGGYQVSYDMIAGIQHSRPGDAVRLCLIRLPRDCPPGDERGRVYRATNLRSRESWQAPDAEHACGGA
jgi:hypothetical protein